MLFDITYIIGIIILSYILDPTAFDTSLQERLVKELLALKAMKSKLEKHFSSVKDGVESNLLKELEGDGESGKIVVYSLIVMFPTDYTGSLTFRGYIDLL